MAESIWRNVASLVDQYLTQFEEMSDVDQAYSRQLTVAAVVAFAAVLFWAITFFMVLVFVLFLALGLTDYLISSLMLILASSFTGLLLTVVANWLFTKKGLDHGAHVWYH